MGDPINSKLDQILDLLRQSRPEITVGGDMIGRDKLTASGHIVIAAAGSQVTINKPDLAALGVLQREADARRREEIYLVRFICDETYARWGGDYLPLAGNLRPPGRPSDDLRPAMRYHDRQDASASPAGQPLNDIREAISEHHKTKLILLGQRGPRASRQHLTGVQNTCQVLAASLRRRRTGPAEAGQNLESG